MISVPPDLHTENKELPPALCVQQFKLCLIRRRPFSNLNFTVQPSADECNFAAINYNPDIFHCLHLCWLRGSGALSSVSKPALTAAVKPSVINTSKHLRGDEPIRPAAGRGGLCHRWCRWTLICVIWVSQISLSFIALIQWASLSLSEALAPSCSRRVYGSFDSVCQ